MCCASSYLHVKCYAVEVGEGGVACWILRKKKNLYIQHMKMLFQRETGQDTAVVMESTRSTTTTKNKCISDCHFIIGMHHVEFRCILSALISVLEFIPRSENSEPKLVCDLSLSLPLPLSLSLSPSLLKNRFHVILILEAARLVH